MPPIRLLLFDLDGTLADTGRDLANSANYAVGRVAGLPPRPVEEVTKPQSELAKEIEIALRPVKTKRWAEADLELTVKE